MENNDRRIEWAKALDESSLVRTVKCESIKKTYEERRNECRPSTLNGHCTGSQRFNFSSVRHGKRDQFRSVNLIADNFFHSLSLSQRWTYGAYIQKQFLSKFFYLGKSKHTHVLQQLYWPQQINRIIRLFLNLWRFQSNNPMPWDGRTIYISHDSFKF